VALFFDDFAGAADTLLTSRSGWAVTEYGGANVAALDGSGGLKTLASGDVAATIHDTGVVNHYAESVVGANAGINYQGPFICGVRMSSVVPDQGYALFYTPAYGELRLLSLGGGGSLGGPNVTLVAGDVVRLEAENNAGNTALDLRIYVNGSLTNTITGQTGYLTNTRTGMRLSANATLTDILRSFSSDALGAAPDTEDPTLAGSINLVGKNDTTIEVSCPAGADNVAVVAYEWSKDSGASWVDDTTNHIFTGLTGSTAYGIRVRAKDAAGRVSSPALALSVTTDAPAPDVTLPILVGAITITNKTDTSFDMECPVGTDNAGSVEYDYSLDGGSSWTDNGTSRAHSVTGRTTGETVNVAWRARDGAGNLSTPVLTASVLVAQPITQDITAHYLTFPGKYSNDANARIKLTGANLPPRFNHSLFRIVSYNQHDGYYGGSGYFDDLGSGPAAWPGGHYEFLLCPYATATGAMTNGLFDSTDGGAVHHFEVGGLTPSGSSNSQDRGATTGSNTPLQVRKGVRLKQWSRVFDAGGGNVTHEFWPDLEGAPDFVISETRALASFPTPSNPSLAFGAFKWAGQSATHNDEPADCKFYGERAVNTGNLSKAEALLELSGLERQTGVWESATAATAGGVILDGPTLANATAGAYEWDNADRPAEGSETITVEVPQPPRRRILFIN
jgi:hypothetical protein